LASEEFPMSTGIKIKKINEGQMVEVDVMVHSEELAQERTVKGRLKVVGKDIITLETEQMPYEESFLVSELIAFRSGLLSYQALDFEQESRS
jgi:hypothetical protein